MLTTENVVLLQLKSPLIKTVPGKVRLINKSQSVNFAEEHFQRQYRHFSPLISACVLQALATRTCYDVNGSYRDVEARVLEKGGCKIVIFMSSYR